MMKVISTVMKVVSAVWLSFYPAIFSQAILPALLNTAPVYAAPVPATQPIHIRVRIAEAVPSVLIRGFDLNIYEDQTNLSLSLVASTDKTSEWEFSCEIGRIRAKKKQPHQSASALELPVLELKEPVVVQAPSGFLHYGSLPYRDEFRIYSNGSSCDVVNHVELEKYLDGLVNSEFSSKWSAEAIAAQVVAARTYAYHQILEAKPTVKYDVDATVKDQVYNGSLKEDFHSSRIAEKTRGLILTTGPQQKPLPIKAFYHSTCGGLTELPEHVWGGSYSGFKRSVLCPYCKSSPRYHWSLELQADEIVNAYLQGVKRGGACPQGGRKMHWRS